mgnify:CR=1 FL=1
MRQVGLLAAAADYAITHNWGKLEEDHRKAKELAELIHSRSDMEVSLEATQSNIVIFELKEEYQSVVTIFDSDDAGIKAMKAYEEKYKLPFCYLPLEKDIADIVKQHGIKKAIYEFVPKLDNACDKYAKLHSDDD